MFSVFFYSVIFFISEVALLRKKDYLRKTTCDWLCGYDAAFVKLLYRPLVILYFPGRKPPGIHHTDVYVFAHPIAEWDSGGINVFGFSIHLYTVGKAYLHLSVGNLVMSVVNALDNALCLSNIQQTASTAEVQCRHVMCYSEQSRYSRHSD